MLAYRGDLSVVELVQVYIYPTPRLLIVVTINQTCSNLRISSFVSALMTKAEHKKGE